MFRRIVVAIIVGSLAGLVCFLYLWSNNLQAGDFTWPLRGAQVLLAGQNPYTTSLEPLPYVNHSPDLWYPLPAVLVAIPFVLLPPSLAAATFFGLSSALLAFAVTKDGWWRLSLFLSVPFWYACTVAQWSPLVMAASLLPVLSPILAVKPNIGVPLFASRPSRYALLGCSVMLLISFAILPSWPLDWLRSLESAPHQSPFTAVGGVVLLLALTRWRAPEGRLLLGLALLPQLRSGYDALPLWFVPRTLRASLLLTLASWIGILTILPVASVWPWLIPHWLVIWNYGPALIILLEPVWKSATQRMVGRAAPANAS